MVMVLLNQFLEFVFDNHNEFSSILQIASIYIYGLGEDFCVKIDVSKELYISDRVQIGQSIYLVKANFLNLNVLNEVEGAWYFEESLVQSKSCLINSTSIFFFCIKTFNFG